jgi:hypothetical protein
MQEDETRSRLIARLQQLVGSEPRTLTRDLKTSLECWKIEQRLRSNSPEDTSSSRRLNDWVSTLLDVESFVNTHGVLPRENNRKAQEAEETRLAFWLRYQRRRGAVGELCSYQRLSLGALEGFRWAPADDVWNAHFDAYLRFLGRKQRAPRYRVDEPEERQLAAWAAKQRHRAKRGHLDETRIERLDTLPIRILPTRRMPRPN